MSSNEDQKDTPEFDSLAVPIQMASASKKLHEMLKAKQAAKNSASTRDCAVKAVRGMEALIHQLLDEDATMNEILAQLASAMPSIPIDDLRYGLRKMRPNKKLRTPPTEDASTASQSTAAAQPVKKPDKKIPLPPVKASVAPSTNLPAGLPAWADGSDRMDHESDEDYRFRKEAEGPPEARKKFIGEH